MLKKQFLLAMALVLCVWGIAFGEHKEKVVKKFSYIGLFANLSAQHEYLVHTGEETWGKEGPDTAIKENFFSATVFKENGSEFDLFFRKFEAKSIFIAGGFWDTEKIIMGISAGKVVTADIKIPLINVFLPIDFSGGAYFTAGSKKKYEFVSGNEDENVWPEEDEPEIGYGVYTNIRLRVKLSNRKKTPNLTVGFKYFIPFNDFDYNPEKEAVSYRLERKFLYIGISF